MEDLDRKPPLMLLLHFGNEGPVQALTGVLQVGRVGFVDAVYDKKVALGLDQKTRGLAEYRVAHRQIRRCDGSATLGLNNLKLCIRHLTEKCGNRRCLERFGPTQQQYYAQRRSLSCDAPSPQDQCCCNANGTRADDNEAFTHNTHYRPVVETSIDRPP